MIYLISRRSFMNRYYYLCHFLSLCVFCISCVFDHSFNMWMLLICLAIMSLSTPNRFGI